MLLPLVAVAAAGLLTFRSSVAGLTEFRDETVGESKPIETVRNLLVRADEVGEIYVEHEDPAMGRRFEKLHSQIDRGFAALTTLSAPKERSLANSARSRWDYAVAAIGTAAYLPAGRDSARLDDFHDFIDQAGELVADAYSLNVSQVDVEISSLQQRARTQLLTALATLLTGLVAAGLLARRLHRSIAAPLASLENAAAQFGSDELSHRIPVTGDDELARVSRAFNGMAGQLQRSREELQYQALHDPLTGLPNMTLFMDRMEHAIARSNRKGTPFSVLYLDLDGFKAVNDTLGHEAGDELLVAVSERIRDSLRVEDTAARLGGDEFAILLEEADLDGAIETTQRLTRTFDATWASAATPVPITLSIGVATRQEGEELNQVLRHADAAMYAAKAVGKGQWRIFGPDLLAGVIETQTLRSELQLAVDRGEFVIHYQPIINLQTGAMEGVEALVRWNHPERGLLQPLEFLREAEESGHILHIDRWVLQEACRQVCAWQKNIPAAVNLCVSVNLSARQLQHPGLAQEVAEALSSSGLTAGDLMLEITETALVGETEAAATELGSLRKMGVKLALDDFGTGYSSLTHLLSFPIDYIKIDRSFVSAIGGDEARLELTLAIVKLAKTLNLKTVAEGIECVDQLNYLKALDCEFGQGYFFAKPQSPKQLELLLHGEMQSV